MSLDEEAVQGRGHHPRAKRLGSVPLLRNARKSNGGSSIDLSTSIVPEDLELPIEEAEAPQLEAAAPASMNNPLTKETSELFRKRSSSLPRILPPIMDRDQDDEDDEASIFDDAYNAEVGGRLATLKQMDQTSNLIVRELQKFVCRHATDVSQVLPLPLPANSRQQNQFHTSHHAGMSNGFKKKSSIKLDWKHTRILLQSLAKLHAISYALRDKCPGLFQEIASSLSSLSSKRQVDLDNKAVLVKILETHTPLFEEGCYEDIIASVRSQASELYSVHTCPLFPVIIHGNIRNLMFKYTNDQEVKAVKLPSLRLSTIGSPLIDIYGALHNFTKMNQGESSSASNLRAHLQTYHASFTEFVSYFRVLHVADFTLETLEAAFKKYELTGMIISSVRKKSSAATTSGPGQLGRSYSLGGHRDVMLTSGLCSRPLLMDGQSNKSPLHDLGSDLSKLALDIPFSHDEDEEDTFQD